MVTFQAPVPVTLPSLDSIFQTSRDSDVVVIEYGKYVHTLNESARINNLSERSRDRILMSPWAAMFAVEAAAPRGMLITDGLYTRHGDAIPMREKEFNAVDFCGTLRNCFVRVLTGSVQDLIAAPRVNEGHSRVELRGLQTHTFYDPRGRKLPVRIIFEKWRVCALSAEDFESVLRAKISECLEIPYATTIALLDPTVPSALIPGLRAPSEMVRWSSRFRSQRHRTGHGDHCPSLKWGDIGSQYSAVIADEVRVAV